jgi:hypothetical protein
MARGLLHRLMLMLLRQVSVTENHLGSRVAQHRRRHKINAGHRAARVALRPTSCRRELRGSPEQAARSHGGHGRPLQASSLFSTSASLRLAASESPSPDTSPAPHICFRPWDQACSIRVSAMISCSAVRVRGVGGEHSRANDLGGSYVFHRTGHSQEDDQLFREGRDRLDSLGRQNRIDSLRTGQLDQDTSPTPHDRVPTVRWWLCTSTLLIWPKNGTSKSG